MILYSVCLVLSKRVSDESVHTRVVGEVTKMWMVEFYILINSEIFT